MRLLISKKNKLIFYFFVLFLAINCGGSVPQDVTIKLNPNQKFQTITGWEATSQSGQNNSPAFDKYKDKLFDEAVNNLGINRLRLELKSGTENPKDWFTPFKSGQISEKEFNQYRYETINDNDDPFVINPNGFQFSQIDSSIESIILPVKRLLEKRNEKLFVNLNVVDFDKNRGNANFRLKDNPEEYAEFILAVYQHIQTKYGFVPDAVEVVLEPDNHTGWTATNLGQAIVATAKRLQAHNFKPAFIAPSTTNAANAPTFIDEIANIPGAMDFITEFSYHRYSSGSDQVIEQIVQRAKKYNKQTAMLEWIGADYETLHKDLKVGNNSAWQQFTLAFPAEKDNGGAYFIINDRDVQNPLVITGSRTKFFKQYFRYIRAGAQRIGAEASNSNFDPLAFINSNSKYVVVVKSAVPGNISVEGLPPGVYGISYTTASEADKNLADVVINQNEILKTIIPEKGVLTIFAKS